MKKAREADSDLMIIINYITLISDTWEFRIFNVFVILCLLYLITLIVAYEVVMKIQKNIRKEQWS